MGMMAGRNRHNVVADASMVKHSEACLGLILQNQ